MFNLYENYIFQYINEFTEDLIFLQIFLFVFKDRIKNTSKRADFEKIGVVQYKFKIIN